MLEYVVKLTKDATRISPDDHVRLRAAGFDDRGILQITLIAAALALLLVEASRAGAAPLEEARVRATVRDAARTCRETPTPARPRTAEAGDYLGRIRPLLDPEARAAPTLRTLSRSGGLDPFEARLAILLAERVEHPERFERVRPYLQPAPPGPWDPFRNQDRGAANHWRIPMRPLEAELMAPDFRDAWRDDRRQLAEFERPYLARLEALAPGDFQARRRVHDEFARRRPPSLSPPRLDPDFLAAWEEAMVRPLPWPMKEYYVIYVGLIHRPESFPSLGAVVAQAWSETNARPPLERRRAANLALEQMTSTSPRDTLLFLAGLAARAPEGAGRSPALRRVAELLVWDNALVDALPALEANPDTRDQAARLREALRLR